MLLPNPPPTAQVYQQHAQSALDCINAFIQAPLAPPHPSWQLVYQRHGRVGGPVVVLVSWRRAWQAHRLRVLSLSDRSVTSATHSRLFKLTAAWQTCARTCCCPGPETVAP